MKLLLVLLAPSSTPSRAHRIARVPTAQTCRLRCCTPLNQCGMCSTLHHCGMPHLCGLISARSRPVCGQKATRVWARSSTLTPRRCGKGGHCRQTPGIALTAHSSHAHSSHAHSSHAHSSHAHSSHAHSSHAHSSHAHSSHAHSSHAHSSHVHSSHARSSQVEALVRAREADASGLQVAL